MAKRRWWIIGMVCFWGLILAQGTPLVFEQGECTSGEVMTAHGAICGLRLGGLGRPVTAYLGIPFAESTAGENRFEPPVPKAAWTDVFAATAFGPACPQNHNVDIVPQSEDCLVLNVWVPEGASSALPVMVYIPGGAFTTGSSADPLIPGERYPLYDGAYLAAAQNIVVVTLNYRVGVLGFLGEVAGRSGNYGMKDQQLAFRWVQETIRDFGGDPARVTLAGESAGATSVALHALSVPSSADLFQQIIMQSNPFGIPYKTPRQAFSTAELYLLAVGCKFRFDQAACLKDRSVDDLLAAQARPLLRLPLLEYGLAAFLTWAPIIDGKFVVNQPVAAALGEGLSLPTLMGSNTHEGTIFFDVPGAPPLGDFAYRTFARTLFGADNVPMILSRYPPVRAGDNTDQVIQISTDYIFTCSNRVVAGAARAPVYFYRFSHVPSFNLFTEIPRCANEACHADELAFVFGSATGERSFTPEEAQLSAQMSNAWGSFVVTGTPAFNGGVWPELSESGQLIDWSIPVGTTAFEAETCAFWNLLGYPIGEPLTVE
jgi:carboxylesterase type B